MPKYKRILLKLSGEVLAGDKHVGIDFATVQKFAKNLAEIRNAGIELALVIGGGNMIRGRDAQDLGFERVDIDAIGMLGTVMNALAVKSALENIDVPADVLSAIGMPPVAELYSRGKAQSLLASGHVVMFAAGTGHPFFSTDTAAFALCRENGMPVWVMNIQESGWVRNIIEGAKVGTIVKED